MISRAADELAAFGLISRSVEHLSEIEIRVVLRSFCVVRYSELGTWPSSRLFGNFALKLARTYVYRRTVRTIAN